MRILSIELPAPLRVGGLEKASREIQRAVEDQGHTIEVTEGTPPAQWPDLAHFHGLWSPAHARLARRLCARGIPYVSSPHGMLEPWALAAKRWKKMLYFHLIEGRRLRRGRAVLATAEQEAQRLRARLPGVRVDQLPLGSFFSEHPDYEAARAALGWNPTTRTLLYLSRIHRKKGLLELVQALAQVRLPADQQWQLVIVGEGDAPYLERCRAAAAQLAGKIELRWLGPIWGGEKWSYLKGADLLCLPTYSENFGLIILEALEVGTPILTTVETPWKPVAEAGFGWVTEPTVSAYQAALESFAHAPLPSREDRARAAGWARQQYAWDSLGARYSAWYEAIITAPSTPPSA